MIIVKFKAEAAQAAIRAALATLSDMTPIYRDVGEYMVKATRERFVKGEAPDGSKWAAKSQATLERYKKLGYGTFRKPLIGPSGWLSREISTFADKRGVVIGSSLIYSGVMQFGAAKGAFGSDSRGRPVPWGRIPARVWLGVGKDDETAIIEIAEKHLGKALGGGLPTPGI